MFFNPVVLIGIPPLALLVFLAVDLGGVCVDKPWQKWTLAASAFIAAAAIIAAPLLAGAEYAGDATFLILPIMLIPGIALRVNPWPQQIYTYCLLATTVHLSTMVAYGVNALAGGLPSASIVVICALAALVTAIVMHYAFAKRYRRVVEEVPKGWVPASVCTVIGLAIMLYFAIFVSETDLRSVTIDIVFTVFMLLICVSTAFTIESLSFAVVNEHNLKLFKEQALRQQEANQLHESMREDERRRRHDQRHALQVVIDELKDGDSASALNHLEEMRGETFTPTTTYCRNTVANAAFSLWADKAEKADIDVSIRANVPEELKIGPVMLASIFGNLLENAYEGCMRVERTEAHRFITATCQFDRGKLSLQIKNSCRKDIVFVNGIPQTQKRGGGIGTRSAKDAVERLGGICSYSAKNGIFEARVIVPQQS